MDYMTPQEAAEKWGIGLRRVQYYCAQNMIPGTVRIGRQWLIPINASRPVDRRTKIAKNQVTEDTYHFPIFIYSTYFSSKTGLNTEELRLLEAQTMMIRGEYTQSALLCSEIFQQTSSTSIKMGALYTNYYNYLLLGLFSNMISCLDSMELLCEQSEAHKEDYRLIIAACKYDYTLNPGSLDDIDIYKLSPDAMITYKITTFLEIIFGSVKESTYAIRVYSTFCRELEAVYAYPALFIVHCFLTTMCPLTQNHSEKLMHIEEACRIAHENNYISLISKFYRVNPAEFMTCLRNYGADFSKKVERLSNKNYQRWQFMFNTSLNQVVFPGFSREERELLLLLTYNISNQVIALLKGVPLCQVTQMIKKLCSDCNCHTKAELIKHAKTLIAKIPEN